MKRIRLALLASVMALASAAAPAFGSAAAHAPKQAYMFLKFYSDSSLARLELFIPDVERALTLGWDVKGRPSKAQVEANLDRIRAYAEAHFALANGSVRETPIYRGWDFRGTETGEYLLLEYVVRRPPPEKLTITLTPFFEHDDTHRNLVVVQHNWKTGTFDNDFNVSLILSPSEPTQVLDLSTSSVWRGFVALVRLGVWHIWIGIDHILFLFALILPSVLQRDATGKRWKPADRFGSAFMKILTIVTCFTVAHTITLSVAALGLVEVPSRLVESVIAGSIAVAALHNLWPVARVNEAVIAFVFGLFHGFGFASVLGSLGLGTDHLVLSLLGFNVGVEIGQVAIIACIFPILFLVRRLRIYDVAFRLASAGLIAIALLWVAERSMGFNVPVVPIVKSVFGIGSDSATA
jgi:hypothetical protein